MLRTSKTYRRSIRYLGGANADPRLEEVKVTVGSIFVGINLQPPSGETLVLARRLDYKWGKSSRDDGSRTEADRASPEIPPSI